MTRRRRSRQRPPQPDQRRPLGPQAAALVARNATRDRAAEYPGRRAEVATRRAAAQRRARRLLVLGVAAGACVGAVAGFALAAWPGAIVGLLLGGNAAIVPQVVARLAARRGARAWDWKAQRHRLLGDPSRRVGDVERAEPARDPRRQR